MKILTIAALCSASLTAMTAQAQVIRNSDLIGNGDAYGGPKGWHRTYSLNR